MFPEAFFKASKLRVSLAVPGKVISTRPKNAISTHQDSIYLGGCPTQVWILVFFVWDITPQGGVPYHKVFIPTSKSMPMKHVVNSLSRRLDPQMGATIDRKDIPTYLSIGHPSFGTQY